MCETAAYFFFFNLQEDANPHKHCGDIQQVSEVENQFRLYQGTEERKRKEKKKNSAPT